ncbi:uncharacterized protein PtrM4_152970 [Pyrenophora tritici-repentis]|uniref:Velvet domain-containing protein n=1 Tax=Pyrenophora tritici-repentis TaxID=45151 RepID=A0A834RIS5_9PLEO|nr:hypothetical protein PtrM4_152970 [Pyrenophora tritici-repentis]
MTDYGARAGLQRHRQHYFVLMVDLWNQEGTAAVNLVRHSSAAPQSASAVAQRPRIAAADGNDDAHASYSMARNGYRTAAGPPASYRRSPNLRQPPGTIMPPHHEFNHTRNLMA